MVKFRKLVAVDETDAESKHEEEPLTLDPDVVRLTDDLNHSLEEFINKGVGTNGVVYTIDITHVNKRQLGNIMILQALFGFKMTEGGKPFPGISEYVVRDPTEFKLYEHLMKEPDQCSYAGRIGKKLGFDAPRTSRYLKKLREEDKIRYVASGT